MLCFTGRIADRQLVGLQQRRRRQAIPVGDRLVVLGGFVLAAVLEADQRVAAERHQVGKQEAVRRFDLVLGAQRRQRAACAGRMSRQRQRGIDAAPIVAAAAPLLGAGALRLRRLAVVEEEARVTLQRAQHRRVRKHDRGAHQLPRPVAAAFDGARIEQHQVLACLRVRMIRVAGVKIPHGIGWIPERCVTQLPLHVGDGSVARPHQRDVRCAEERHRKITAQVHALAVVADHHGQRAHQVFAVIAVVEDARAVEQRHGCIDRRCRPIVPGQLESGAGKCQRLRARHRKLQRPDHPRTAAVRPDRHRGCGRQGQPSGGLFDSCGSRGRRNIAASAS